jgi:glycosyltransferase involved in cell wall biosynthesis
MKEDISICILAYNHEKFIDKVLDGIFSQVLSYTFIVYVNDDCSSDETVKIIEKYQSQYPDKVVLFKNERNRGQLNAIKNFVSESSGKYLTFCDGDDYWIENTKLQQQIDFLESNSDFVAYCHDAVIEKHEIDKNNELGSFQKKAHFNLISQFTKYSSSEIQPYELLNGQTYIQNCTLIWRNFDLTQYFSKVENITFNLDWYFSVILATKGKIYFQPSAWAVYSDHAGGRTKNNYFHSYLNDKVKLLKTLFKIEFYNKPYFKFIIFELMAKEYYGLIIMKSEKPKSKKFVFLCLKNYLKYNLLKSIHFTSYVIKYRDKF